MVFEFRTLFEGGWGWGVGDGGSKILKCDRPKGGRGSSLNPKFFDILIGTNTVGGRGSKGLCHKKNAINFCSLCSSFMYFRMIK